MVDGLVQIEKSARLMIKMGASDRPLDDQTRHHLTVGRRRLFHTIVKRNVSSECWHARSLDIDANGILADIASVVHLDRSKMFGRSGTELSH